MIKIDPQEAAATIPVVVIKVSIQEVGTHPSILLEVLATMVLVLKDN